MKPPRLVYSPEYRVDIGQHVFPTSKFNLIYKTLLEKFNLTDNDFIFPSPASDDDILLVHTPEYLTKLKNFTLTLEEQIRLEIPYNKEIVRSFRICCNGTYLAARLAVENKVSTVHIGGGFHHAFPGHGEGFCIFNDVAFATVKCQNEDLANKVLVIDCDVHQGNGTAKIFQNNGSVYTYSIHQENNYPFIKPASDKDISLKDKTCGDVYINFLRQTIPNIIQTFNPELIIYLAGADPYMNDQLGGLFLSMKELILRDRYIYNQAKSHKIPITTVLAGGYAFNLEDTVQIHINTIKEALKLTSWNEF